MVNSINFRSEIDQVASIIFNNLTLRDLVSKIVVTVYKVNSKNLIYKAGIKPDIKHLMDGFREELKKHGIELTSDDNELYKFIRRTRMAMIYGVKGIGKIPGLQTKTLVFLRPSECLKPPLLSESSIYER